jgi:hypothetical protein
VDATYLVVVSIRVKSREAGEEQNLGTLSATIRQRRAFALEFGGPLLSSADGRFTM